MATTGLFTREEMKQKVAAVPKFLKGISTERLQQLGTRAVRAMNPSALHPEMKPSGPRRAALYILGEAPGAEEDLKGKPFVGKAGKTLRAEIPDEILEETRINNCVRTRPPNNRTPFPVEIECFRTSVEEDIERARPRIILGLGNIPLGWMLGSNHGGIKLCRGRRFPVKIRSHRCWFYPTLHPSYINRVRDGEERDDNIPGREWERVWQDDLTQVCSDLSQVKTPKVEDLEHLWDGIKIIPGGSVSQVEEALEKFGDIPCAVDLECNRLRPYSAGAKILAMGVGTYRRAYSFAIDHPQATWTDKQKRQIHDLIRKFLKRPGIKIAHNALYELEWFIHFFGKEVVRAAPWHCTMQQSYCLDERRRGHSLDFLCKLRFGLWLKSVSKGKKEEQGLFGQEATKIDRMKLESTDLTAVLKYNGLDVKFTEPLHRVQMADLKEQGLLGFYERCQLRRVPTFAIAQSVGLPVDQTQVRVFEEEFTQKIKRIEQEIRGLPEVAKYEKRFGRFNPNSPDQVVVLFRDVLHRIEVVRASGYSSDKNALTLIGTKLSKRILDLREVGKLKGTYVDGMNLRDPETLVYPDGRLHPQYNLNDTATGRTSSDDPNCQNFPKRKHSEIRKCVVAPPGHWLLATDYGQLEYRVLGMVSKDKAVIDSLWHDYDVHLRWAQKLIKMYDVTFRKRGKDLKKFRSEIKNQLVFPAFFGAGEPTIARGTETPLPIIHDLFEEFWQQFHGVKTWQRATNRFYEQHGYVECLTGRRRRAPMNYNQLINAPIQGTASDIVIDAMNRLSERAQVEGDWSLCAPLNVHDDLSFLLPEKHLDDRIETIVRAMVLIPWRWARIVPMQVEVSIGRNWAEMEPVGKFNSNDL